MQCYNEARTRSLQDGRLCGPVVAGDHRGQPAERERLGRRERHLIARALNRFPSRGAGLAQALPPIGGGNDSGQEQDALVGA
jgi:hypothetical protein